MHAGIRDRLLGEISGPSWWSPDETLERTMLVQLPSVGDLKHDTKLRLQNARTVGSPFVVESIIVCVYSLRV